jgi:hypothetical protein
MGEAHHFRVYEPRNPSYLQGIKYHHYKFHDLNPYTFSDEFKSHLRACCKGSIDARVENDDLSAYWSRTEPTLTGSPFDYCEAKHGNCSCRKTGTVHCASIERTFSQEAFLEAHGARERSNEVKEKEMARIEASMHRTSRFMGIDKEILLGRIMMVPPKRGSIFGDYIPTLPPIKDYELSGRRFLEAIWDTDGPRQDPTERRRGSIPEEKAQPWHKFIHDPVKRKH